MTRAPDYLIIGTMKGGTTALQDFICKHPDVATPEKKEIHYFSLYPHMSREWYLGHFNGVGENTVGEASPTYFDVAYTQAIPRLIKSFNQEIKLILIVRDPVERAVSHFHHLKNINKIKSILDININDFFGRSYSQMLRQSSEIDFCLHQVIDFSLYARKFMTYLSVFERKQILVVDSLKLRNDAANTMNSVFRHIGISDFYDPEFELVKYSSGKGVSDLESSVREHLDCIFDEDVSAFWRAVNS